MPTSKLHSRDALPEGTVLHGYTLGAVVGHGGFGIVYRAKHNELDLVVAIKEYLPIGLALREGQTIRPRSDRDRGAYEDGLRRFRDEARALISLRSNASTVSCREFFRAHGSAYLVMEYEEGRSLAEVLASREADGRPFGEADLLAVMLPLLEGLAHVHESGMLHRDIKPSNILIRHEDEKPVLIDFGAVKQEVVKHSKSLAPYTEGYAALEQVADSGDLGPWTDMYGVGAVMWRMVAGGNRPWTPPDPTRVENRSLALVRKTDDPLPPAVALGKERFSEGLLEAVDGCLRLQETERPQVCHDLLEALRSGGGRPAEVLSQASKSAQPDESLQVPKDGSPTLPPPTSEPHTGRRRAWTLALAGLAVGLVLGLQLQTSWGPSSDNTAPSNEGIDDSSNGTTEEVDDKASSDISNEPCSNAVVAAPGRRFRDCSVCPEMIEIPPGCFMVGSPETEVGRDDSVAPQRRVEISYPLAVSVYEVTIEEWDACANAGGCGGSKTDDYGWGRGRRPWTGPRSTAEKYLYWLQYKTGQAYRFLSQSEWEYVARAGTKTRYHFGDELTPRQANYGKGWEGTREVGSYPANAFGLHDIHGNVSEWTAGTVNINIYGSIERRASNRGGSWESDPNSLRSAGEWSSPTTGKFYGSGSTRGLKTIYLTGLRVARTLTP